MSRLTPKRYQTVLKEARGLHDSQFLAANPRPKRKEQSRREAGSFIERMVGNLWVIWLLLALAGAIIAVPHTLNAVLPTVDLESPVSHFYAFVVFFGVELALVSVELVRTMKRQSQSNFERKKQASLAGMVNALARRIGVDWQIDLRHLPERRDSAGFALVGALFFASLSFNLVDALSSVPALQPYMDEMLLFSRVIVGALGPVLLVIAGHNFAHEAVAAGSARLTADREYEHALDAWEEERRASWERENEIWVQTVIESKGFDASTLPGSTDENPTVPISAPISAGNGRH